MTETKQTKQLELPNRIDVSYPYIVLADFEDVFGRFENVWGNEVLSNFESEIVKVLAKVSPDFTNFMTLKIKEVIKEVEARIKKEKTKSGKLGIVQLDRYIDGNESGDCFQIEVSRGVAGGLVPRPGCNIPVERQFENLAKWVIDGDYDSLLIVDDVLAFGDTLTPMLNGFKELSPKSKLKVLVGLAASGGGWNGLERVRDETGVEVEAVTIVKAGEENEWTSGMAMPALRDFTFLGGKIRNDEKSGKRYCYPYFLPFSMPAISFMPKERRYDAGIELMDISIAAVEEMERSMGRSVTMKDLQDVGFGLPDIKLECLQDEKWLPNQSDSVWEYLQYCKYLMVEYAEEIRTESLK